MACSSESDGLVRVNRHDSQSAGRSGPSSTIQLQAAGRLLAQRTIVAPSTVPFSSSSSTWIVRLGRWKPRLCPQLRQTVFSKDSCCPQLEQWKSRIYSLFSFFGPDVTGGELRAADVSELCIVMEVGAALPSARVRDQCHPVLAVQSSNSMVFRFQFGHISAGRAGSADHCDHEPGYRVPDNPAISSAAISCAAFTPEPQ